MYSYKSEFCSIRIHIQFWIVSSRSVPMLFLLRPDELLVPHSHLSCFVGFERFFARRYNVRRDSIYLCLLCGAWSKRRLDLGLIDDKGVIRLVLRRVDSVACELKLVDRFGEWRLVSMMIYTLICHIILQSCLVSQFMIPWVSISRNRAAILECMLL